MEEGKGGYGGNERQEGGGRRGEHGRGGVDTCSKSINGSSCCALYALPS